MWDEQERFSKVFSKSLTWLMAIIGVLLAAISLATGNPAPFFGFLLLLVALIGAMLVISLAYGFAAICVGGLLLGVHSLVNCCVR
jgi:hypothetical protein